MARTKLQAKQKKQKAAAAAAAADAEYVSDEEGDEESEEDEGDERPKVKCNPLTFDPTVRGSKDKRLLNTSKSRHAPACVLHVCVYVPDSPFPRITALGDACRIFALELGSVAPSKQLKAHGKAEKRVMASDLAPLFTHPATKDNYTKGWLRNELNLRVRKMQATRRLAVVEEAGKADGGAKKKQKKAPKLTAVSTAHTSTPSNAPSPPSYSRDKRRRNKRRSCTTGKSESTSETSSVVTRATLIRLRTTKRYTMR